MKKLILLPVIFLLLFSVFGFGKNHKNFPNQAKDTISINSEINPGMELMAIMLWLSSNYQQPIDSKYKADVWKHFSKYRKHPEILKMKKMQFYPDFTETGLLLSNFPDVKIEIPENSSWYSTMKSKENVVSVLNGAKIFAKDTKFWEFYQKQKPNYSIWTDKFAKELKEKEVIESIDSFFRYTDSRKYPQVTIYLEPLNNWGAHAINFERFAGRPNNGRVSFQIGPAYGDDQFIDSPLSFSSSRNTIKTVWHESNHIYLKKTLIDYESQILKSGGLFNASDLASQNIKTWQYAFEENLIRAIVAALSRKKFGEDAYKQEVNAQMRGGFIYVSELAELISTKYLSNSASYSNFDDFMPEIIAFLEAKKNPANVEKPF